MRRLLTISFIALIFFGSILNLMVSVIPTSELFSEASRAEISPVGSRGVHGVIRIDNNTDFFITASMESWPGNGQFMNPYIIQGFTINANGTGNCIYIGNTTDYFIIRNCELINSSGNLSPISYGAGITLNSVQNGRIENNNISGNRFGVYLYSSNNNKIFNNTCMNNTDIGIFINSTSWQNTIKNNTCQGNNVTGVSIKISNSNVVENNNCSDSEHAIYIDSSRFNVVENNNCSGSQHGIYLFNSTRDTTVRNNTCSNNEYNGLWITSTSYDNTFTNNTCSNNNASGIKISSQSITNTLTKNKCTGNKEYGIYSYFSAQNIFDNNICLDNQVGFRLEASTAQPSIQNTIINNNCSNNNGSGMEIIDVSLNSIEFNICDLNNDSGLLLQGSSLNTFANNTFNLNNNSGIEVLESYSNDIKFNNISGNGFGIDLDGGSSSAYSNTMFENIISYNTDHGIILANTCSNNRFFHNNILYNTVQAAGTYSGTVYWDNGFNEGNFWSDYTGLDNGSNGRTPGDGIGDTDIPHPTTGYDNYPFTNKDGWDVLSPPVLHDPGQINSTGNYTITWNSSMRAIGYILEEDTNHNFNSPKQIYSGSNLSFEVTNKPDGEYYYHLKIYNDYVDSWWSPSVDIYVDLAPSAPTGLMAKNITGHNVTLRWNLNPEDDIQEYYVFKNATGAGSEGPFVYVEQLHKSIFEYKVTELEEETLYYFVITATDFSLTHSPYSNVVLATTLDETRPGVPKGLTATAISDTEIELSWDKNTDVDLAGYFVYMNDTDQGPTGDFKLIETINVGLSHINSTVVPNLIEQVTYYFKLQAFDEVPNKSPNSSVVSATTPDLTPPAAPTGLSVTDATESSLTISWTANSELDVVGYFVYRSTSPTGTYVQITLELITGTSYVDTGLNESTTYFYKVTAIDDADLASLLSDYTYGSTLSSQQPPELVSPIPSISFNEDSIKNNAFNLNTYFIDPNDDPLHFSYSGNVHVKVIINDDGSVTLSSDLNWFGEEDITFYAFDGINNVSDTVTVEVRPVNDPPETPIILEPLDGAKINKGDQIDFRGSCEDVDLPGDVLTFTWSSSISGTLGTGENFIINDLAIGEHLITLRVADSFGAYSMATINITVQKEKEDTDGEDKTDMPLSIGLFSYDILVIPIIIIVIILVIVIFVIGKSKRKKEEPPAPLAEEETGVEEELGKEIEQPSQEQIPPYPETPTPEPPQEQPIIPTPEPPSPYPPTPEYAPEVPQEQPIQPTGTPEPGTEVMPTYTSTDTGQDTEFQTESLQAQRYTPPPSEPGPAPPQQETRPEEIDTDTKEKSEDPNTAEQ